MGLLTGTFDLTTIPEQRLVRRLGVDEHRFRRVRYVRDDDGSVTRVEPWTTMLTCLDSGAILGVVDGRRGPAVKLRDNAAPHPPGNARWSQQPSNVMLTE